MTTLTTDDERRHAAAVVRAARMGGALARHVRAALASCVDALPERPGHHDMLRAKAHVAAAVEVMRRVLGDRFRRMLMDAAEREHWLSAVEFTRAVRGVSETHTGSHELTEGWRDYLRLIIPAPALEFLEGIVGPLWRRVVGAINPERASNAVLQGIAQGKDRRAIATDLTDVFDGYEVAARRVARTAGLEVATRTQLAVSEQIPELVVGYELNTVLDERVRPEHRAAHGRRFYREPTAGQRPLSECPQPPIWDGKVAWNCFLPGNKVEGHIIAAVRSHYSGKAVQVVTESGREFRVTMKHPVLTANGWVAAGTLKEGDHLFRYEPMVKVGAHNFPAAAELAARTAKVQNAPATVEEVFASLAAVRPPKRSRAEAGYFHGDGQFVNGDVDVVWADRVLAFAREPGIANHLHHFRHERTRPGFVGHGHLSGLPIIPHGRPLEAFRFGSTANVDAVLLETSKQHAAITAELHGQSLQAPAGGVFSDQTRGVDDQLPRPGFYPEAGHPLADGIRLASVLGGDLLNRHPGLVVGDKVASASVIEYTGHVYDLMTVTGCVFNDALLLGNCRCFLIPIIEIDGEEV